MFHLHVLQQILLTVTAGGLGFPDVSGDQHGLLPEVLFRVKAFLAKSTRGMCWTRGQVGTSEKL